MRLMTNDRTPAEALKVATEKRILNEFRSKILNEERMDKVFQSRKNHDRLGDHSTMLFHCECDDQTCTETISMSTEEYQNVHNKTKYFIVIPSHIRADLEEVISLFNNYALVAKFFPHPHVA